MYNLLIIAAAFVIVLVVAIHKAAKVLEYQAFYKACIELKAKNFKTPDGQVIFTDDDSEVTK